MYLAVNLTDDPRAKMYEKVIVIDRNDTDPARMREIWHGSLEQAMKLRDALDAVLPAAAREDAPSKVKTKAKQKPERPVPGITGRSRRKVIEE